jgi:hypothetical protein
MEKFIRLKSKLEAKLEYDIEVLRDYVINFTTIGEHSMDQYEVDILAKIDDIDQTLSRIDVMGSIISIDTAIVPDNVNDN